MIALNLVPPAFIIIIQEIATYTQTYFWWGDFSNVDFRNEQTTCRILALFILLVSKNQNLKMQFIILKMKDAKTIQNHSCFFCADFHAGRHGPINLPAWPPCTARQVHLTLEFPLHASVLATGYICSNLGDTGAVILIYT